MLQNGDVAVLAVSAVRAGVPGADTGSMQVLESARRAAGQSANAEFSAYVGELERTAKIKRNDQVFE